MPTTAAVFSFLALHDPVRLERLLWLAGAAFVILDECPAYRQRFPIVLPAGPVVFPGVVCRLDAGAAVVVSFLGWQPPQEAYHVMLKEGLLPLTLPCVLLLLFFCLLDCQMFFVESFDAGQDQGPIEDLPPSLFDADRQFVIARHPIEGRQRRELLNYEGWYRQIVQAHGVEEADEVVHIAPPNPFELSP